MLYRIAKRIQYAWLLIRKAGLATFLRHLLFQLYGSATFVGVAKDLTATDTPLRPQLDYTLRPATQRDMAGLLSRLDGEDADSVYEILGRELFYARGFDSCYVAELDSGDICHFTWLLTPDHNDRIHTRYNRLPLLKEGDSYLENSITYSRYRGKGLMSSVSQDIAEIARAKGYKRIISYVDKNNQSSLKALARVGFRPFEEVREVRRLLTVKRHRVNAKPGAVVIGGTFQSLGIMRSLARRHIPVYLLDSELCIGRFSNCKDHFFLCPKSTQDGNLLGFLERLAARQQIEGWVIYPNDDETAAFLARHREELSRHYRVPSPSWDVVRLAYDKKLTYTLAESLGIPIPRTYYPRNRQELERLELEYPVIIKPAIRANFYNKTKKKALRADTRQELLGHYDRAVGVIDSSEVMVQELIPGGPQNLYSFGSFFRKGEVVGKVIARRARQHPMDFGHATTFAETVDIPELEVLSTRLLSAMGYYGISEVEFMQDPRDGKYKLIEINARPWGWHSLAIAAGADLPYLMYQDMLGQKARANGFVKDLKWIRLTTDVPTVAGEILSGRMRLSDYLRSLKGKKAFAVFSWRDPLPFVAEVVLLPYFWIKRGF